MRLAVIFFVIANSAYSQCKFSESYDKMSGNYVIQTQSKVIEGSLMSMQGTDVSVSKVYNKTDTSYFLIISSVQKYESRNDGKPARRIRKGSTVIILLSGDERIELQALQDLIETKKSKEVGSFSTLKEHSHSFKMIYHIPKNHLSTLTQKPLVALRINMEDELANARVQDIEVRQKSAVDLSQLLDCIIPRFLPK